jgi:hypothetical protein
MKKLVNIAIAVALFASGNANAQVPEADWQEFKAAFNAMSKRVEALEAENQELRRSGNSIIVEDLEATKAEVALLNTQNTNSSWAEKVKLKGDFRYRFEDIEEEGKDDRDRNRIRARAALIAKTSDTTEVGIGLATGGDDPVSTNQTLGGGGSSKEVRLDLAYFKWTGLENTYAMGGKFSNPFYRVQKSGLIWDGDFRPEGLAFGWQNDNFFATATYSFIESDSKADDEAIWGAQIGAKFALGEGIKLTAAAKYLDIPTRGREAIFDEDFFGNSSTVQNGVEVYVFDYNVYNASVDLTFTVGELPLSFYGDYIENDGASDLNTGYLAGAKLGSAKAKGSWQLQYQYQDLEADATLGLVTDSDFAGGGTDGEGHKVSGKYAIDSKWSVGATYFDTKRGVDLGENLDYQRLMLETIFKY